MRKVIECDRLLTEEEAKEVEAALKLRGSNQSTFARQRGLHRSTLSLIISRKMVPSERYARELNELVDRHLVRRFQGAADPSR